MLALRQLALGLFVHDSGAPTPVGLRSEPLHRALARVAHGHTPVSRSSGLVTDRSARRCTRRPAVGLLRASRAPAAAPAWRRAARPRSCSRDRPCPRPAMSNAVPWSTEVRTIGRPSVTFTAWPNATQLHRNQSLIVIARDDDVEFAARGAEEQGISRKRPGHVDAARPAGGDGRRHHLLPPRRRTVHARPRADSARRRRSAARHAKTRQLARGQARWWLRATHGSAAAAPRRARCARSPARRAATSDSNIIATCG